VDPIDEVKRTEQMLIQYRQKYIKVHQVRSSSPPFPICGHDVIHQTIDYLVRTYHTICSLMERGEYIHAAVLARPCLEWSLRLMWCRQEEDGWQRIVSYLASETLKAAAAEKEQHGSNPISEKARQTLENIRSMSTGKIPNLKDMLDAIVRKQSSSVAASNVDQTYAIFFKGALHQVAHANLCYLAFDQPASDTFRVARAIRRSGIWIINSSHDYIGMSPQDVLAFINEYISGFELPNDGQQG
jgi:hypothetical protein